MISVIAIAMILGRDPALVNSVCKEAQRQGVDPAVACSVVEVESQWRMNAVSRTGDRGLFQINPRWHGIHPRQAEHIERGVLILSNSIAYGRGSIYIGLSYYNTGRYCMTGLEYASKVIMVYNKIYRGLRRMEWLQNK